MGDEISGNSVVIFFDGDVYIGFDGNGVVEFG